MKTTNQIATRSLAIRLLASTCLAAMVLMGASCFKKK